MTSTPAKAEVARAVFAGGCFWCVESAFDKVEGVTKTTSGYIGGTVENPTYEQVSAGGTGHYEAVEVEYDPAVVSYKDLLEVFWRNVDPLNGEGQFCDIGPQYRAAVFYLDETQKEQAEASKARHEKMVQSSFETEVLPAAPFYKAEDYHQNYHQKNPIRYKMYRLACGRDKRLEEVWGEE